jgi:YcxB-like protein
MISCKLTEDDIIKSHRLYTANKERKTLYSAIALMLIACGIVTYKVATSPESVEPAQILLVMAVLTPIVILTGWLTGTLLTPLTRQLMEVWVRKSYREDKTLQHQAELSWDDEGFRSQSESGQMLLRWSALIGYRENNEFILLYLSRDRYVPIPLAQINNSAELAKLKEYTHKLKKV